MKLKEEHIDKIANLVLRRLEEKNLIQLRASTSDFLEKVKSVIKSNLSEETNLEDEARKLLDQYRPQIQAGLLDETRALNMIKKQLAKERDIVL